VLLGIEQDEFKFDTSKPPHIERPRTIVALAPAFRLMHDEGAARIARLQPHDWAREIRYPDGELGSIADLLWRKRLMHAIHHRRQLTFSAVSLAVFLGACSAARGRRLPRGACRHQHGSGPVENRQLHLVIESKMSASAATNDSFSEA
jgi:hypothetical protein